MQTRPANEFAHPSWPDLSDKDEDVFGYDKKVHRKRTTHSLTKKKPAKTKKPSKAALKQAAINKVVHLKNKAAEEEEQAAVDHKGIRATHMGQQNGHKQPTRDEETDAEPAQEDKDMDILPTDDPAAPSDDVEPATEYDGPESSPSPAKTRHRDKGKAPLRRLKHYSEGNQEHKDASDGEHAQDDTSDFVLRY
ncbi:hypothetical protein TRAPUB_10790 [Trametes pubescens]|uniref:Uncharacterized protein n=1 Tax=Trametes pubescens TaxID=154538 RepID=A0A1M2VYR6_TRAPU|nr:hypothetical protein TRAPUB_10790 [Trametes pubescens]